VLYRGACVRALNLWYNGFSEFKEWLGVLRVNDVISYRSLFSREVLGKRRGLSIFLWSFSVSMSRMRRRINPFKQQFASSQLSI
jgi:hypothetical protein